MTDREIYDWIKNSNPNYHQIVERLNLENKYGHSSILLWSIEENRKELTKLILTDRFIMKKYMHNYVDDALYSATLNGDIQLIGDIIKFPLLNLNKEEESYTGDTSPFETICIQGKIESIKFILDNCHIDPRFIIKALYKNENMHNYDVLNVLLNHKKVLNILSLDEISHFNSISKIDSEILDYLDRHRIHFSELIDKFKELNEKYKNSGSDKDRYDLMKFIKQLLEANIITKTDISKNDISI